MGNGFRVLERESKKIVQGTMIQTHLKELSMLTQTITVMKFSSQLNVSYMTSHRELRRRWNVSNTENADYYSFHLYQAYALFFGKGY